MIKIIIVILDYCSLKLESSFEKLFSTRVKNYAYNYLLDNANRWFCVPIYAKRLALSIIFNYNLSIQNSKNSSIWNTKNDSGYI